MIGEERAGRIGHLAQARLAHLEDPDLLGRSEPVLRGADEAEGRVPLALEVQDHVDEVLERLRAGDRPVLRHVPGEDHRGPGRLGVRHEPHGRLADLADAPGGAVELVHGRGLHRVDDEDRRCERRGRIDDRARCRARPGPGRALRPAPASTPSRPARRWTWVVDSSPVAYRASGPPAALPTMAASGLEHERGLADPGLAAEQHDRTADQAAAEDAVELADPDGDARGVGQPDGRAGGRPRPPRSWRGSAAAPAPLGSRTTVSTRLFQVPQVRHWPSQRRKTSPQELADVAALRPRHVSGRARSARPCSGLDRRQRCLGGVDVETRFGILVHHDGRAGLVAAQQEVLGEHVLDHVLDDPAQRSRAVGDVVARA